MLGIGRIKSVFGVHAHDIRSEQLHGIQRIGLTVQDQVGYVEINPDIVQPDIFDGAHQRNRRLLPGLAAERLAVLFAVLGHGADGFDGFRIDRIVGVFGNEPAMRLHAGDTSFFGKVRHLLDTLDARLPILARD